MATDLIIVACLLIVYDAITDLMDELKGRN